MSSKSGAVQSGTAIRRIILDRIREAPVCVAPMEEQLEIASEVGRRLSVIDVLGVELEKALRLCAIQRQAILKRAFEGRLVPQDPSDPPAAELLARIKAEKAKREAAQPRKRSGR